MMDCRMNSAMDGGGFSHFGQVPLIACPAICLSADDKRNKSIGSRIIVILIMKNVIQLEASVVH